MNLTFTGYRKNQTDQRTAQAVATARVTAVCRSNPGCRNGECRGAAPAQSLQYSSAVWHVHAVLKVRKFRFDLTTFSKIVLSPKIRTNGVRSVSLYSLGTYITL